MFFQLQQQVQNCKCPFVCPPKPLCQLAIIPISHHVLSAIVAPLGMVPNSHYIYQLPYNLSKILSNFSWGEGGRSALIWTMSSNHLFIFFLMSPLIMYNFALLNNLVFQREKICICFNQNFLANITCNEKYANINM